jgi:hypothetical protein
VGEYSRQEAAERAGVGVDDLDPLVELGVLTPDDGGRFSAGDVRRIGLIRSFVTAGIPLDGLAADLRQGGLSLAWLDSPSYDRYASYSGDVESVRVRRLGVMAPTTPRRRISVEPEDIRRGSGGVPYALGHPGRWPVRSPSRRFQPASSDSHTESAGHAP